jgi:hypothetical protein
MASVELGRSAKSSLEALPDTGTAPSHRSEGNVEDGAGAWPGLLYLVIPLLFFSNCALFDTYFASKTSSHLIQLFRGIIPPLQNLYVLYCLPVHKDSIVYTTFCLFRNSLYVHLDFDTTTNCTTANSQGRHSLARVLANKQVRH